MTALGALGTQVTAPDLDDLEVARGLAGGAPLVDVDTTRGHQVASGCDLGAVSVVDAQRVLTGGEPGWPQQGNRGLAKRLHLDARSWPVIRADLRLAEARLAGRDAVRRQRLGRSA